MVLKTPNSEPFADAPAPVINADELLQRCLGRIELAERVLAVFQDRLDKDLAELECLLQQGDIEGIKNVAHRIKGSAASASAVQLSEQASLIEERAHSAGVEEIRGRLQNLKQLRDGCQFSFQQREAKASQSGRDGLNS